MLGVWKRAPAGGSPYYFRLYRKVARVLCSFFFKLLIALCFQITQDPSTFSHLRFKQRKYFSWQVISPTANQLATRVLDRSKSSILGMASRISLCVKPALLSRVSMRDTIFRFLNNLKEEETNFKFYFCLTSKDDQWK